MKRLCALLLLSSVVQLCFTASALDPVTCGEDSHATASHLAMHHINEHHDHGYKFKLHELQRQKVEKVDDGCNIELQLHLRETKCHVVNPKNFEECEIHGDTSRGVMANCTVLITVKNSDSNVTEYECETQQVLTDEEMMLRCPDCPKLIALNDPEGLNAINKAVEKFNHNETNPHYYILQEVGRIQLGYIMSVGMSYYPEFVLVETNCPRGSRIAIAACTPLCPDRAHHAVCQATYFRATGLESITCDIYPPANTTALGPGEEEPACIPPNRVRPPRPHGPPYAGDHGGDHGPPPHAGDHGPPPHAGGHGGDHGPPPRAGGHAGDHGPPPHAGDQGPPPRAGGHAGDHGPPPHAGGQRPPPHAGGHGPPPHAGGHRPPCYGGRRGPPFHPSGSCHRLQKKIDPAIHPICPWPLPNLHVNLKPRQN